MNTDARHGDWMQTITGRQFYPIDPRPEDIDIEDIAHALSMMCRFGGHCIRFYSVAEHSLYVSHACDPNDALWGLLHDAAEAYVADIVRPAKRYLAAYREMEAGIMAAICQHFGLPLTPPASVKRADDAILADEAMQIMSPHPKAWTLPVPPTGRRIAGWNPDKAKSQFLRRFDLLKEMRK